MKMAAQRLLRKLDERNGVSRLLSGWVSEPFKSHSFDSSFTQNGDKSRSRFSNADCTQDSGRKNRDEQDLRNTNVSNRLMMYGNSLHSHGQQGRFFGGGVAGCSFYHQSVRFCSTTGGAVGDGLQVDNLQAGLAGVADKVSEVTTDLVTNTPVSEIAAATSISYPWTAFLQETVNAVHIYSGLPWWGSIVLTTVLARLLAFPLVVSQVRATARFTTLRPELMKINEAVKASGYDPDIVKEGRQKMAMLFTKHKTSPASPLLGGFIQAPIFMCFFFGLRTMAENVESFKQGGTLWFTDLTTPDEYFILPVMTSLAFWITVEFGVADGMQGQPNVKLIKNMMRGLAVIMIPLMASFPKALFCYWFTSNIWSMAQGAVLRNQKVKDYFGIPDTSHLDPDAQIPPVLFAKQQQEHKQQPPVSRRIESGKRAKR